MTRPRPLLVLSLASLYSLVRPPVGVDGALRCSQTQDCRKALREGSECIDGFCSNPYQQGCLKTMGIHVQYDASVSRLVAQQAASTSDIPKRTCNLDDTSELNCQKNLNFEYPQVRIHNGNWESSIFFAWILQILLMEVLGVPATVGLITNTTSASGFYSPTNTLEYSSAAYPFEALKDADACHLKDGPCAQVMPEVWNGQKNEWTQAMLDGYVEPLEGNGQVGKGSWYLPRFTAERDDSLVSFYGLSGEENRHKLADAFRKPTTWRDYCELVSPNNCSTPDVTALHFPVEDEQHRYFVPGSYQGFFRLTPENNCTAFPDTCIGHIVGPGCDWSTNVDAQIYWNDIKLKSDGPLLPNGGYEYSGMIEIWRAADATKSNVVFWWWRPEALVEEFHETESQFQQILLPEATDVCSRSRVDTEARCSEDIIVRRGSPEGACDQEAHALQKVISKRFQEETQRQPLDRRSPSYDLIKAVKITDLEINNMLKRWINRRIDKYGNDAREAVCEWVVENIDNLLDFVPAGYPKQFADNSSYESGLSYTAIALGVFSAIVVLVMARLAYNWRHTKVFVYAQAHIVYLILMGFFLVALGAIFTAREPSPGVCKVRIWLVNLGYTVGLVPLLVKIAAINKIVTAASKMKRVKISRANMFRQVAIVVALTSVFLLIWTIMDPPQEYEERVLPDPEGNIVETTLTCASENSFWTVIALAWQGLLLLIATVLAFQSRDIAQDFNESQRLGTMIYSHMIFLVLRGIVYFLGENEIFPPDVIAGIWSILLSLDTLFATIIYFVPKCLEARKASDNYLTTRGFSRSSAAITAIERNAAIAYNSYANNVSMIDNSGKQLDFSQRSNQGSASFRSDDGPNAEGGVSPKVTNSWRIGGSLLRNRLSNHLAELAEVSKEDSMAFDAALPLSDIHEVSEEFSKNASFRRLSTESNRSNRRLSTESNRSNRRLSTESNRSNRRLSAENGSSRRLSADAHISKGIEGNLQSLSEHSKKTLGEQGGSLHSRKHAVAYREDDGDDDSSDSMDTGGPRFNNPKANEDLERSVQMLSTADINFGLDEEDLHELRLGTHSHSYFTSMEQMNSLGILPEEEFGSNGDTGHESE